MGPSRRKSYTDKHRRALEFQVGDSVFLKVAPMTGVMRFRKKGKLSPKYMDPLKYLRGSKCCPQVGSTLELASVHNVFHILMLKKYVLDLSHVLNQEPVEAQIDLSYI